MCKGIVFDLDGTLADTRLDIAASVNILRSRCNLPPLPVPEIVSYVGNGSRKLVERSLKDQTASFIDEVYPRYQSCYMETLCVNTCPYPGVPEGLAELKKAGFSMAVLSNKPQTLTLPLIQQLGLASMFDVIQGGCSDFPLKPEPAGVLNVLSRMNIKPENSWMVGDHYTDLETGRRAGMKSVFCGWGFGNPREEKWDFRADSFEEFVRFMLHEG